MPYKALYRTYRPNSFEEVAGQKHIVKTLQHAVEQNKIAHAYLFCGPRGTGKTSVAKIFAKTINCESHNKKPCLVCDNCLAVQEGNHPDIIEIDAASNNGVEEVRSLIEKVKYAPLKGKYKVYIIDEVHMMSTGAFNALLKTIEEPPAHIIFILATTEPQKVLPTIISRCQRFDFTKVSRDEIIQRVHTVLDAEHITCEEEVIRIIAQLADGGLRDALSILDQCIAYARDNLLVHHINEIYGITTIEEKLDIFNDILDKNAIGLLNKISILIEKGIDIKRLTVDLIELLKESIIFEYTKDSSLLHSLDSDKALILIKKKTIKERFEMIHLLMETYDKYRTAANVGSYFEVCLLQMLEISPTSNSIDNISIASNKDKVKTQQSRKPNISSIDVSRETSSIKSTFIESEYEQEIDYEEQYVNQSVQIESVSIHENRAAYPLDKNFILSLLAGATKPEKACDIEKFRNLLDYLSDFKWARLASLLRDIGIIGSGTNYLIVCVESQAEANAINEADSLNEFHEFITHLLGKNKKIFAIAKEQQVFIISEFKERMMNGTLPDPIEIKDVIIDNELVHEETQEETILNLFGEENIIITEE